jgi:large subunit ribosomal protein L21
MSEEKQATTTAAGPYAIVETGGKQYRVKEGDSITVERLGDEAGADITLDRVLMIGGAGTTKIGTPVVDGASVSARVDEHFRGEKLIIFKFKRRKNYARKQGHRQGFTEVRIKDIKLG